MTEILDNLDKLIEINLEVDGRPIGIDLIRVNPRTTAWELRPFRLYPSGAHYHYLRLTADGGGDFYSEFDVIPVGLDPLSKETKSQVCESLFAYSMSRMKDSVNSLVYPAENVVLFYLEAIAYGNYLPLERRSEIPDDEEVHSLVQEAYNNEYSKGIEMAIHRASRGLKVYDEKSVPEYLEIAREATSKIDGFDMSTFEEDMRNVERILSQSRWKRKLNYKVRKLKERRKRLREQ